MMANAKARIMVIVVEFGELNTLLEDISTYLEDKTANVVSKQKKKEEEDRSKGLAMRKAALETYASMST